MKTSVYLASRSPRRRELLRQIGIAFQVIQLREDPRRGVDVDEASREDEPAAAYALRIAQTKARAAAHFIERRSLPRLPVLGADTTVVRDAVIIGKPNDAEDAARMLRDLAGQRHEVISGVAVASHERLEIAVSSSQVWFRKLSDAEIRRYVATGEPLDKAGAYAIQGRAAPFVTRIEGSYSGIMGLPLFETSELLARFGIATT